MRGNILLAGFPGRLFWSTVIRQPGKGLVTRTYFRQFGVVQIDAENVRLARAIRKSPLESKNAVTICPGGRTAEPEHPVSQQLHGFVEKKIGTEIRQRTVIQQKAVGVPALSGEVGKEQKDTGKRP